MKIKVLIADDNLLFCELLARRFQETSIIEVVAEAEDDQELLRKIQISQPDIVLIDIGVPRLKGIETTLALNKNFPDIKVIALTNRFERNFIKSMFKADAWGYFLKNTTYDELTEAIIQVNSGRKCICSDVERILIDDYLGRDSKGRVMLTERESEILKLLAEGKSIREISEILYISIKTVCTHKQSIFDKMQFENLVQLFRYAMKNGIVS